MKNAEYEVIQRVVAAGMDAGADVFVVDNDGYPLWASHRVVSPSSPRITADDCQFVISLHFESPKLVDIHSYAALWNPPPFYKVFGYLNSTEKLASHDDVLSCESAIADAHAANLFDGYGRPLPPSPLKLFHSLPESFALEPRLNEKARLFYVGINWERISGEKGRHHDLLKRLDEADLVDLFGPEEFHGVAPWEGYRNYRGSIPFDGRSIVTEINRAGVCLALSSDVHQKSGIMSNRLFEGLAAGAAIIANPHPFIDRHFSDCVYVVDDAKGSKDLARDVQNILLHIRDDPAEALRRARLGQQRFKERFSLDRCIGALLDSHGERVAAHRRQATGDLPDIEVVIVYEGVDASDLEGLVRQATTQHGVGVHLTIVCDKRLFASCRPAIEAAGQGAKSVRSVTGELYSEPQDIMARPRRTGSTGPLVAEALSSLQASLFCLMGADDHWFSDHLSHLAMALARQPDALGAISGGIVETLDEVKKPKRRLEGLLFSEFGKLLYAREASRPGRTLFRRGLLQTMPRHLINCLDGTEHRALALWAYIGGPLTQSAAATFVRSESAVALPAAFIDTDLQVQMILDSVRSHEGWTRLVAASRIPATDPYAADATIRPVPQLQADVPYATVAGEDGPLLFAAGFSQPEAKWTWIDGRSASLRFRLPSDRDAFRQMLVLTVGGRKNPQTNEDQICTIKLNQTTVVDRRRVFEDEQRIIVPLAESTHVQDGQEVRLDIQLRHASRVYDKVGKVIDPRRLGLWIKEIEVKTASGAPPVAQNRTYALTKGGNGVPFLAAGFHPPESDLTWICGVAGRLRFQLPSGVAPAAQTLRLWVGGRPSLVGDPQTCILRVNGQAASGPVDIRPDGQWIEQPLASCGGLQAGAEVWIELELRHAEPVLDETGAVIDARRLGLWVGRFEVETLRSVPEIETDWTYALIKNGDGVPFLENGFFPPEFDLTWIRGAVGWLKFRLPSDVRASNLALRLELAGRASHSGEPQRCTVRVNGRALGDPLDVGPERHWETWSLAACDDLSAGSRLLVEIGLRHAEPVLHDLGAVVDPRPLGMSVSALEVTSSAKTEAALGGGEGDGVQVALGDGETDVNAKPA